MGKRYLGMIAVASLAVGVFAFSPAHAGGDNWAVAAAASTEWHGSVKTGVCTPDLPGVPHLCSGAASTGVCHYTEGLPEPPVCPPAVGVNGIPGADDSAVQATGAAYEGPRCGSNEARGKSWRPDSSGSDPEQLTLFYEPVLGASEVDIYVTGLGGFVTQVDLLTSAGVSTVFTGPDNTACGGILSIPISPIGAVVGVSIHTHVRVNHGA